IISSLLHSSFQKLSVSHIPQSIFCIRLAQTAKMRFQLSAIASLALLLASASASAEHCNSGETQMCCEKLDERNVGYYCATPDQQFPCYIGSPQLQAMCCTGYDLTPRGVSIPHGKRMFGINS